MDEGSGANTWMHKSKQILVQGHPLDQRITKVQKLYKTCFSVKKLEGLRLHYISPLNNLCCDFLSLLTFYRKTIVVNFSDFLKSYGPKGCPCAKNSFHLYILVLAKIPPLLNDAVDKVGGVEICQPATWALQNKVPNCKIEELFSRIWWWFKY